jgi:cytochrome c-type biogenesis protein CcmF
MHVGFFLLPAAVLFYLTAASGSLVAPNRRIWKFFHFAGTAVLVMSFILIVVSCVRVDLSLSYAARYSSSSLPYIFRISSSWAGQEGSFLLWISMSALAVIPVTSSMRGRFTALPSFILFLFSSVAFMFANPFLPSAVVPSAGAGLNPLLVNFWMAIHPPLLFMGFACALSLFVKTGIAVIAGEWKNMLSRIRRSALLCMFLSGLGLATGAFWAYETLGWGGFWGWDPVENGSLVPFLLSIALVHGIALERRGMKRTRSNIVLSYSVFITVLFSVFITRSGLLSDMSVHSFSESVIGVPLGAVLAVSVILAVGMRVFAIKRIEADGEQESSLRDIASSTSIASLACFAFLVLLITSMPVAKKMIGGMTFTFRDGIYNDIALVFGIIFLCGIVLSLPLPGGRYGRKVLVICAVAATAGIVIMIFSTPLPAWKAILVVTAVIALVVSVMYLIRGGLSKLPPCVSHVGFSIFVIGVVASGMGKSAHIEQPLREETMVNGMALNYAGVIDNEYGTGFVVMLRDGNKDYDGVIFFTKIADGRITSHAPLIFRTLARDYYIAYEGYVSEEDLPVIRKREGGRLPKVVPRHEILYLSVSTKPFILLVWIGMILMVSGPGLSLLMRRRSR